jgi:CBS domain-containing protein
MALIREVLNRKSTGVVAVAPEATVRETAALMNEHHVGALVVRDEHQVLGIFTERDVLHRVVAHERDPATTRVSDVMTSHVVFCRPDTSLEEARNIFKQRRIRHLPVMSGSRLEGLISIGDVNAWQLDDQEVTIQYLNEYYYSRL